MLHSTTEGGNAQLLSQETGTFAFPSPGSPTPVGQFYEKTKQVTPKVGRGDKIRGLWSVYTNFIRKNPREESEKRDTVAANAKHALTQP